MKYGCISIEKGSMNIGGDRVINIGDHMQLLSVLNLYHHMGIDEKDIVRIEYYDMFDYSGEDLVLPINFIWFNPFWGERELILPPSIHPVFLGIHSIGNDYSENEIKYLKDNEPIGCRDAYTYRILTNRGVKCYLHGCLTSTFPKRTSLCEGDHVFMIDVQEQLYPFIPNDIRERATVLSHQFYGNAQGRNWESLAKHYLQQYSEEATLIITSRLHCASPCMALGIPVILTPTKKASSFSWINELIPVYGKDEWDKIDWNPCSANYEDLKTKILREDIERINSIVNEKKEYSLSNYFDPMSYNHDEYENGELLRIKQFVKENWDNKKKVRYAIWGITQMAEHACKYIETYYPNAQLVAVFDNYRQLDFRNITSKPISEYNACENVFLLATGNTTSIAARKMFDERGWDKGLLCTCYEGLHNKMEKL